jgi:hypothetical protein
MLANFGLSPSLVMPRHHLYGKITLQAVIENYFLQEIKQNMST